MLLYRVIRIKMATCPLGSHSKSHLITPHCVLHYASLAVNTAHFVDSNSVDSLPNRITTLKQNRLKGSKLDELIYLFLEILLQFLIMLLTLCISVTFVIYIYCCILIFESLPFCLLICTTYCLFIVILCCLFHIFLNVLNIYLCFFWLSCSDIPRPFQLNSCPPLSNAH